MADLYPPRLGIDDFRNNLAVPRRDGARLRYATRAGMGTGTFISPMGWAITAVNDNVTASEGDIKFQYEDFIMRETGISSQLLENNRLIEALSNPAAYLKRKNADLYTIGEKLAEYYKNAQQSYINNQMPHDKAKERALRAMEHHKEFLMKEHELEYPTRVTESAIQKQNKINNARNY